MSNKPHDVNAGDRPSAAHHNEVADAAFRELGGSAPGFSAPDGMAVRSNDEFPEPYAKCQSDWAENTGDPKVSVKMCDADGTNERGSAFDVYLQRRRTKANDIDANAYEDDIIRWAYDYEGRRVMVSIPPVGIVFGELDGILEQGGSQTLKVFNGAPLADSGETITVYDWFLEAGAELADETKCKAVWYCGRCYVDTARCPV